jgi:5-methylcytosine-specific restriction endonuclease McrA
VNKQPRLTTLKPRLQELQPRLTPQTGTGWRAGKTTNDRGYTYAWQQARERFLRANPLCAYCRRDGRIDAATLVDHIVPHRGDPAKFWDETNWQSLCKACHDSTKAREEREAGIR